MNNPAEKQGGGERNFTRDEKALLIARLARGKSALEWRAAEEEPLVDRLMQLLDALPALGDTFSERLLSDRPMEAVARFTYGQTQGFREGWEDRWVEFPEATRERRRNEDARPILEAVAATISATKEGQE